MTQRVLPRIAILSGACVLLLGMASCSSSVGVASDVAPTTATEQAPPEVLTPEPLPETPPAKTVDSFPPCDQLVPIDEVQTLVDPQFQLIEGEGGPQASPFSTETSSDTYMNAAQSQVCVWGVVGEPRHSQVIMAILTPEEREAVEAEAMGRAVATEDFGGMVSYDLGPKDGTSGTTVNYRFRDNVWVAEFSSTIDAPLGSVALLNLFDAS